MLISKITPMATEVLSLSPPIRAKIVAEPVPSIQNGIASDIDSRRYDTFESHIDRDSGDGENLATYTPQFRTANSSQPADPDLYPPIDITKPEVKEVQRKGELFWAAAESWNALVEQLKGEVKARGLGYNGTIKLFKQGYADWKMNLRNSDPETYALWVERMERFDK